MSTNWDPSIHSKSKLGLIGNVPVSPFVAIGAQIKTSSGALHLKVMGDQYITGTLRGAIPPSRMHATIKAIQAQPQEPSWSGSDSMYRSLTVNGSGSNGIQILMAGDVEVCKIVIDSAWTLISSDEPIDQQTDSDDEDHDED